MILISPTLQMALLAVLIYFFGAGAIGGSDSEKGFFWGLFHGFGFLFELLFSREAIIKNAENGYLYGMFAGIGIFILYVLATVGNVMISTIKLILRK